LDPVLTAFIGAFFGPSSGQVHYHSGLDPKKTRISVPEYTLKPDFVSIFFIKLNKKKHIMAIQEGPVFLEAVTIDGIIHYKWRGLYLMRKAPVKGSVKQTKGTKQSAASFGVASEATKLLYRSFGSIIPAYLNNMIKQNRGRAVMRNVVGKDESAINAATWNYTCLEHFSFNEQALFPPQIRNENICSMVGKSGIQLSLPALNLKKIAAPKNTQFISFRFMAGVFDFQRNRQRGSELMEIHCEYEDAETPAREFNMRFAKRVKTGNVVIVALQISFFNNRHKLISSAKVGEYEASGIIGVFVV